MYRKISFVNNSYYHIYNRGIDKRVIFENDQDFKRFLDCLRFFNSPNSVWLANIDDRTKIEDTPQERLVDIVAYCLMPNHFHLLLMQKLGNGIPTFMRKLCTGYSMYFNLSRERNGRLFQGPYKAKMAEDDNYLTHLSRYIHLNPIELVDASWKEVGIRDKKKAFHFLNKYPWSSYMEYLSGTDRGIISENVLHEMFPGGNYKQFVESWVNKDMERIDLP